MLSATIGWLAYRRNSLSQSGVAGAIITGTAIFGFGGWTWGLVLIAFFVSSTLLSHFRRADKTALAEKFAKGERRDLAQTLANGGFGALLALAVFLLIDLPGKPRLGNPLYVYLTLAYLGAIASANADTWATELGVLSRTPPRLITTGRPVPPGTSGGITSYGTMAALAGSTFIGITAFLLVQVAALATTGALLSAMGRWFGSQAWPAWSDPFSTVYWAPLCRRCIGVTPAIRKPSAVCTPAAHTPGRCAAGRG